MNEHKMEKLQSGINQASTQLRELQTELGLVLERKHNLDDAIARTKIDLDNLRQALAVGMKRNVQIELHKAGIDPNDPQPREDEPQQRYKETAEQSKQYWQDPVTGKFYKTQAAMKMAIGKRKKAEEREQQKKRQEELENE